MADITDVEIKIINPESKTDINFPMTFADGSGPVTLTKEGPKEWVMNYQSHLRENIAVQKYLTPKFYRKPDLGSILNFGEGQTFLVVNPSKSALNLDQEKGVYVKKIPLESRVIEKGSIIEGYKQIKKKYENEAKNDLILELDKNNIPLTKDTLIKLSPIQTPSTKPGP
jgi:hypothetical protein